MAAPAITFAAFSTSASGRTIEAFRPPISACEAIPRAVAAAATCSPDRGRAGEGHDVGELDQRLARRAGAGDDVEHALGQRLAQELLEEQRAGDGVRRGLEDDGVAVGHGRRGLPQRDGEREVPGRDEPGDAARAAAAHQQRAQVGRRGGGDGVAVGVQRGLRLVAQDPHGAGVLAHRLDPSACPPRGSSGRRTRPWRRRPRRPRRSARRPGRARCAPTPAAPRAPCANAAATTSRSAAGAVTTTSDWSWGERLSIVAVLMHCTLPRARYRAARGHHDHRRRRARRPLPHLPHARGLGRHERGAGLLGRLRDPGHRLRAAGPRDDVHDRPRDGDRRARPSARSSRWSSAANLARHRRRPRARSGATSPATRTCAGSARRRARSTWPPPRSSTPCGTCGRAPPASRCGSSWPT